jgi:hypothetical protein
LARDGSAVAGEHHLFGQHTALHGEKARLCLFNFVILVDFCVNLVEQHLFCKHTALHGEKARLHLINFCYFGVTLAKVREIATTSYLRSKDLHRFLGKFFHSKYGLNG